MHHMNVFIVYNISVYDEQRIHYDKLQLEVCVNVFIGSQEYYTQFLCYSYDTG
jgi:hypothetical protein